METSTLKFFWNGIKVNGGNLQGCHYSDGELKNYPAGTLSIYKKGYDSFSKEIREFFVVNNNSDSQTDYFETDTIRVIPTHKLYNEVKAAIEAGKARYAKMAAKRALI